MEEANEKEKDEDKEEHGGGEEGTKGQDETGMSKTRTKQPPLQNQYSRPAKFLARYADKSEGISSMQR
jgi:hypothetical protein